MTTAEAELLGDALRYLEDVVDDDADPAVAKQRLAGLRAKHAAVRMRLLWQREEYDGSRNYDLLLTRPDHGTVSLSFCPDRALPWPLRGGQRISERLLLRVDGTAMEVSEAIACLDFLWDEARLTDRLVTACLVREALADDPAELTDDELQHAMDGFRRAHGLLTADATQDWMARRCLALSDLEELVENEAAVARLRRKVTDNEVHRRFASRRSDHDRARMVRLAFGERAAADNAVRSVRSGRPFFEVAQLAAAARELADDETSIFETRRRGDLGPDMARLVFGAEPGHVVGPLPAGRGYAVVLVLGLEPAVLDEETEELIRQELFTAWLQERRRTARVEWFWGNVARTGPPGGEVRV